MILFLLKIAAKIFVLFKLLHKKSLHRNQQASSWDGRSPETGELYAYVEYLHIHSIDEKHHHLMHKHLVNI